MYRALGVLLGLSFSIAFLFQNCSESANFSKSQDSHGELPNNQTGDLDDDKDGDDDDVIIEVPPDPDNEVNFSQCTSYKELPASVSLFTLPKRSTSGICYYKKMIDAIANHPSGTEGEKRVTDVVASNHNGDSSTYVAPFLLGENSLKFANLLGWKMALSGDFKDPKKPMKIDNFYLVQLQYGSAPQIQLVSAFGTADAEPGNGKRPILLNSKEIKQFHAFAPNGTATVEAIDLTPSANQIAGYAGQYNLRLRALDCGGSANGTDVYLVFY